ncbi:MAG: transcription elongation factor GreA [Patescibacteria group bacterium]|nr:transcription elongation factor GreA [Patescibacteria group bacterium]
MTYYLTEDRLNELKAELEDLKKRGRLDIAERLKKAKELGDLSENSEYAEAKDEQQRVERRIDELEDILKDAEIIKKGEKTSGVIGIGSTVEVVRNGKTMKFFIGGRSEVKPEEGFISNESPLGQSLLGHAVGDSVTVETPTGSAEYVITRVE